ncbi:MAG: hypothetical protein WC224_05155, partial [Sphaerochaetaceae bacterium]
LILTVFISCDNEVKNAKADFWEEFKIAVAALVEYPKIAKVTYNNDDITVKFKDEVTVDDVKDAAEALFVALGEIVDSGELILGDETFDLDDEDVVVDVAKHLLGEQTPEEFLGDDGVKVTSPYSANVTYGGVEFTLNGTLTFDIAD